MWPDLQQALERGAVLAYGATPGWAAWLAAQLAARESLVVVVAADDAAAREIEADIRFFIGGERDATELDAIASLPGIDVSPYADLSPDRSCIVERVATLYRLTQPALRPRMVVTSAEALARRTLVPQELATRGLTIKQGDMIDRDQVAALLVAGGWARTPVVDEPGTFALRGGVIDVYAPLAPHPVRIELFGDEVESLRWFDAESQRTLRQVDHVHLHPVRETIATGAREVRTRLREYADEIAHPTKATRRLIEQLEAGEVFVGIEGLTPAFHDEMVGPEAYVPADARWLIVDPDAARRTIDDLWKDAEQRYETRDGKMLAFAPDRHFVTDLAAFSSARRVELPTLEVHGETDAEKLRVEVDPLRVLRQELEHARTFGDTEHVTPLLAALKKWDGMRVTIASDSQSRTDRLLGVLAARGVTVRTAAPGEAPLAQPGVTLLAGAPTHSFASPKDRVALVTASDIFGERVHHPSTRKKRAKDALLGGVSDWSQLAPGDYLVHQKHGVGRYHGLKKIAVGTVSILQTTAVGAPTPKATEIDALHLEYDGGTLYLPVYRLGEVQRYVGAEGHAPRIDKLGGVTWEATQSKVKRHVRVLAEELLQIYAQRASLPGHRFPPADEQFRELEATFPFDETPDQQEAIDAVLGDMEAARAMDRLVCGDVGYGKTEVAMRAIFRAVQGGKQACVLAPTTVLVEQHYRTMAERFKGFGVELGKLSRFQSKGEQIETVKKLIDGKLDVVVGTHRVLSADVRFKDLGLLVIDEEQRFGVAHKERIKKTKTQVDVLTLTATPIPRTLHLAMAGMRDLSIIATPPADRRAVRTFVSRVDDATIKEAIEREIARGGQIFWITPTIGQMGVREVDHRLPNENRPQRKTKPRDDDRTIEEWAEYIKSLVPTARVGIGHGSLTAEQLEKVMVQFVQGELDVLVATTIVESGLDIPRANTMFVARADAFGLAQLYQLRGRIGRSKERAYCYLLVPEPEHITDEARRRLEALQRFTELGAGFQIASQDLEIRGGGELLGAKQSGSIAAVGFDQYVKMLEAAVAELRGEPIHSEVDPELTIEIPGFIPDDYVPDPGQRLELYKRLSAVVDDDELKSVMNEISDRYGPLPGDVILLGELMGIKAIARRLGVLALEVSSTRVAIAIPDDSPLHKAMPRNWRRLPDGRYAANPPARAHSSRSAPAPGANARFGLLGGTARATETKVTMQKSGYFLLVALALAGCHRKTDEAKASPQNRAQGGGTAPAQSVEELKTPLAKIDDVTITLGEFQERINRQSPYIRARYTSLEQKKEFLESLVRFEVLAKEAYRRGLDKDPEVVRTMKQVMIQKLMRDEFDAKVTADTVADAEMKTYYDANLAEYVKPEEVRVSAIILKNKAQAERVLLEAKGEPGKTNKGFRDLVMKYSSDEETKLRGGDLRYLELASKDVPAPVIKGAFGLLNTGDVSGVIEAGNGTYYILKQTGRRKSMTKSFDDAKPQIRNKLFREKRMQAQKDFIDNLRNKAKIEINEPNLAKVRVDTSQKPGGDDGHGHDLVPPAAPGPDLQPPPPAQGSAAPGQPVP